MSANVTLRLALFIVLALGLPAMIQAQTVSNARVDFDGDGTIGFGDFILFGQNFQSDHPMFDLSGNGTVDFLDFVAFASVFGQTVVQVEAPRMSWATSRQTTYGRRIETIFSRVRSLCRTALH